MGHKLTIGDRVVCRLYNTPEHKFYGSAFTAKIENIQEDTRHPFLVRSETDAGYAIWLARREILRRI